MSVNRDELVALLDQMVRIESVTPWLIPTGSGEQAVAEFIAGWLAAQDVGIEVELDVVADGRPNLLARLRGVRPGPTLCLNAHSDTVGYDNWADEALTPRIDGNRMYGLGAVDDKSGCVAALITLRDLARAQAVGEVALAGDVLVACVIDEEGVSSGTEHLVAHHAMDAAIVIEPMALPIAVTEHQGFGWIDVVVHGRAAHGSTPDEGIDAIVHMAEVIRRLHDLDEREWRPKPDARNGRTVFHTGTIRGGTDYATYPSEVTLGIEIGTQPGETLADRVRDIEQIFDEIRRDTFPGFRGEVVVKLDRDPFRGEGYERLYAAMDEAANDVLGRPLDQQGMNAWTDAALLQAAGVPTILIGPLGGNLHAPQEWADLSELLALTELLEATVVRFLS
jgi:acetylornithine deacetylase/succinyl-diaminopimelate desuccinylase-like protein